MVLVHGRYSVPATRSGAVKQTRSGRRKSTRKNRENPYWKRTKSTIARSYAVTSAECPCHPACRDGSLPGAVQRDTGAHMGVATRPGSALQKLSAEHLQCSADHSWQLSPSVRVPNLFAARSRGRLRPQAVRSPGVRHRLIAIDITKPEPLDNGKRLPPLWRIDLGKPPNSRVGRPRWGCTGAGQARRSNGGLGEPLISLLPHDLQHAVDVVIGVRGDDLVENERGPRRTQGSEGNQVLDAPASNRTLPRISQRTHIPFAVWVQVIGKQIRLGEEPVQSVTPAKSLSARYNRHRMAHDEDDGHVWPMICRPSQPVVGSNLFDQSSARKMGGVLMVNPPVPHVAGEDTTRWLDKSRIVVPRS